VALDVELKEKTATIAKYELEIKRRTDEIEKKTKEVDRYNRQYEKMMSAVEGPENLGPLEATIAHVNKELETKATEGKEMQRRWVGFQVELVALVGENNTLSEAVQVRFVSTSESHAEGWRVSSGKYVSIRGLDGGSPC